jgi:hypothetical protein
MKTRILEVITYGSSLAITLLAAAVSAQSYFYRFVDAPNSIACTNTDVTLSTGQSFWTEATWNLPSDSTPVQFVFTAGSTIRNDLFPLGQASGTSLWGPGSIEAFSFTSTPFPFTVTLSATPQVPGAITSTRSFLCASATATNFTIANFIIADGGPVGVGIPTLGRWELLMLTALLGAASYLLLRGRLSPR